MTKLEDTINLINQDLDLSDFNREEFLAKCAYGRIQKRNESYEKTFDRYLSLIDSCESPSDISRMGKTLVALSDLTTKSYESLLKLISCNDRTFFN